MGHAGARAARRPPWSIAAAVTSERLAADAHVRNRLFPKTRSWFALDAPLELLSPLSVLRIVFGLGFVLWFATALATAGSGENVAFESSVIASALAVWYGLAHVHRTGERWTGVLLVVAAIDCVLIVASGNGSPASFADLFFVVFIAVAAGLFWRLRDLLLLDLVTTIALAVVFGLAVGVARAVAIAVMAGSGVVAASLTTYFLTRTAKRQGSFDADTGLPNGIGLSRRVGADAAGPSFVVAVAHLDGVQHARQALGYEVGTELLRRAVEDFGQVLPPATFIGRVDGDELVVTAPIRRPVGDGGERLGYEGSALELAEILSGAIKAGRYLVGGVEVSLRAHVGLAIAPWDGSEIPELVRRASLSATRAASQGQSCMLWNGDFGAMTAADLALLSDLRLADQRGELYLVYQPQIARATGRVAAVEALLRWSSPTHGPVLPSRFIPLAERTGLIDRLTEWVIDEALDAQLRWRANGLDLPVSINLSPTTLTTPDLPGRILDSLASRGLPPSALTVEVTETAAIDLLQAVSLLRPLHDRGIRISIDDFGTGYTSLAILPDLPLDELKVDQRFVLRLISSPADDAIVRTVGELAHRIGLQSVAEGVETAELAERMTAYGFDLLQGYYFSPPIEEGQLLEYATKTGPLSDLEATVRAELA